MPVRSAPEVVKEGSAMIRWGFAGFMVLLVTAVFMRYTPAAWAGCEGGDSTAGHSAVAFCCGEGHDGGHGGHDGGKDKSDRVITGHHALR